MQYMRERESERTSERMRELYVRMVQWSEQVKRDKGEVELRRGQSPPPLWPGILETAALCSVLTEVTPPIIHSQASDKCTPACIHTPEHLL